MNYLLSIIAGAVQGLTEFLPVSSSGHLVILHDVFDFHFPSDLRFDVFLHFGTFLALLLVLRREVWKIIKTVLRWRSTDNESRRLLLNVIIGIAPAVAVGYFFADLIEQKTRGLWLTAVMLIVVAALFGLAEKYFSARRDLSGLKWPGAFFIGLAQLLAFVPGVSRSGITIITGMSAGLKRAEAARFSFLLSLPLIFGATMRQVIGFNFNQPVDWRLSAVGFVSAFIFGGLAAGFTLDYLSRHSLKIFAWYRLIIGCLVLIWLLFSGV